MDSVKRIIEQDKDLVSIPDLNWLDLRNSDINNIPTPNNVEILPQLQEAWSHISDQGAHVIPNTVASVKSASQEVTKEAISDLVRQAKKDMMLGIIGKALADKLASMYLPEVIRAAKDELVKLSSEQGLIGNVYLDMTAFDSCSEAARVLGKNRVRTARYVVGEPCRHACSSHSNGFCRDMGKNVVSSVEYSKDLLDNYSQHLRVARVISADETIVSKESLREAFLRKKARPNVDHKEHTDQTLSDINKLASDLSGEMEKSAAVQEKKAKDARFHKARPVLAFIQDQMLKGKVGNDLKECIRDKFMPQVITEYSPEIKRMASLQGLLGNVYVDVSYYRDAKEAISAIKSASTNPLYIVQTVRNGEFDDTLERVASATGCAEFPKNGKIDKSVALSYVSDLQFGNRLAAETAEILKGKIEAGSNVLAVIRDAFVATQQYKKPVREGGVQGYFYQGITKQAKDQINIRKNAIRALEAGISINLVEDKLASMMSTPEAISVSREVLASMDEVGAGCMPKCANEQYQLKYTARIKKEEKCSSCIYCSMTACTKQGKKFAGARDLDKAFLDLDPKTAKVQFEENPDVSRADMKQEYDMSDNFGSGMNITLDKINNREASVDVDVCFSREGIDQNISDL